MWDPTARETRLQTGSSLDITTSTPSLEKEVSSIGTDGEDHIGESSKSATEEKEVDSKKKNI